MHKEGLEGARALWDDWTGGVGVFEVLCDRVCVREDDGVGLGMRAGRIVVCAAGHVNGVEDRGEGVDVSAIGTDGGGWRVDGA